MCGMNTVVASHLWMLRRYVSEQVLVELSQLADSPAAGM